MKKGGIALLSALTASLILSNGLFARNAPSFALFDTQGNLVTLNSCLKKQRPVAICFFASYCAPCRREIPEVMSIKDRYNSFDLLLVNIDREGKEKALEFLNGINVTHECLLDIYQETAKRYMKEPKVPAMFLLDKKGAIIFEAVGNHDDTMRLFENRVKKLR
jgi:thiol-disulfide isomerase/thioredoxin